MRFIPNHSGAYKHSTEATSFAGTLQQFGKAQEEQHGSFGQAEEAILLSFKFRGNSIIMEWCYLVWKLEANML